MGFVSPRPAAAAIVGVSLFALASLTSSAAVRPNKIDYQLTALPNGLTVVLSEGVYAVGETTVLKPERRSFTKDARLTLRAEVLPDDPAWNIGRMPTLIHTMPVPPT